MIAARVWARAELVNVAASSTAAYFLNMGLSLLAPVLVGASRGTLLKIVTMHGISATADMLVIPAVSAHEATATCLKMDYSPVSVRQRFRSNLMSCVANVFSQSFFHGTRADLKPGDLIVVGHQSNFTDVRALTWVYFTATLDAAIWGAELAVGSGRERIYVVEPTGPIIDDPNLTDRKFPGNPTLSYRSRDPLRVIAEVTKWQGHSPEQLQLMKENVARAKAEGADIID